MTVILACFTVMLISLATPALFPEPPSTAQVPVGERSPDPQSPNLSLFVTPCNYPKEVNGPVSKKSDKAPSNGNPT